MYTCKKCGATLKNPSLPCPSCGSMLSFSLAECEELMTEAALNMKLKNYSEATEIYALLASFGYTEAERTLAMLLEEGRLMPEDPATALEYYLASASKADAYSAYRYACLSAHTDGRVGTHDFWILVSAILGERRAFPEAAKVFALRGDKDSAHYYRALAADAGDFSSALYLAKENFKEGRAPFAKWYSKKFFRTLFFAPRLWFSLVKVKAEIPPEPVLDRRNEILCSLIYEAKEWGLDLLRFKLAELLSAERTKDGLYTLAMLYAEGVGVKKNAERAITLLDEAVGLGSADAARSLATILLRGELLPPEPALAIAYLERAAALGSPEAYERLGDIYSEGRLAKMDISAALEYYRKAATLGGGSAQAKLDALSYEREGYYARAIREELKNPEGAFESCQLSAAMGYIPAYSTLGSYYENGIGTKRSRREAYRCYLLGAEAGDEAATYNLGRAYAHGIGTARSTSLAIKHLTLASRMGVKAAEGELVALYERKKRKMLRSLFAAAQELYYMHKYEPARKMLEVSAQLGNPKASYLLGALAEFGLGEVYDRARAARLYNEAYEGGFIDSSHEYKKLLLKMSR